MFRPMKKAYTFEETEHWILTARTAVYGTFTSSPEHPPMCTKEGAILEGY